MSRPPAKPTPRRAKAAKTAAEIDAQSYSAFVGDLKQKIAEARYRASLSVNRELILLYWGIGRDILARQEREGWGAKVIDRLAEDLRRAFPEMTGLSARNLKYMRALADAWPDSEFVQRVIAQLPWGHNVSLLDSVKATEERAWYARQAIEHGWSRPVLVHQIESDLFARQGSALTNFSRTLPAQQSELAQQLLKDPYTFDFLALGPDMLERDLERGLIEHLRSLILELGKGFAFVGSQYHLEIGGQDYYLDLLFYHLRLRCFVVIELKIEDFKPEFAGKMNFTSLPSTTSFGIGTISRPSASFCARAATRLSSNMPCATAASRWAWPSTVCHPHYRLSSSMNCRPSKNSHENSR